MAYFLDTVIPDNAVFLFFLKAEQFGLFGTMTPVKGYVNKKTGKPVAPYTGLRRRKLSHPISGNLFGHAADEVASSHIQPEPVKVKKPRKPAAPSPEKLDAFKAKIAHVVAHAKVDAQHAPKQGEVYKKLYLAQLESIKGIPADLLDEAKQNIEGMFKPKTLTAEPPQGKQENSGITKNPIPDRDTEAQYEGAATSIRQLSAEDRETFRILRGTRNAAQFFHLPKAQAALDKLDVKLADLDAQKKEWESSVNFARSNNFDSEVKRATEALNQLSVISGEVYRKRIKAFEKVEHWKKLAENTSAKLEKMVKGSGNPFFDVASQSEITDPAARAQKAKDLATDGKTYQGEIDAERKSKREAKTANKVVVQKDVAEQIQAKIDNSQPKEDGPKEGERNADGLVFRNGRWYREEDKTESPKNQEKRPEKFVLRDHDGNPLSIRDAAKYLKDVAYSLGEIVDTDVLNEIMVSGELSKSGRDTMLMDAFSISRYDAHSVNNDLDHVKPNKLRAVDMEDAFNAFPALRKIIESAKKEVNAQKASKKANEQAYQAQLLNVQRKYPDLPLPMQEHRARLLERARRHDEAKAAKNDAVTVKDVTPVGYGPSDASYGSQDAPIEHLTTEQQRLQDSINTGETILRGNVSGAKRAMIERSVKSEKEKLEKENQNIAQKKRGRHAKVKMESELKPENKAPEDRPKKGERNADGLVFRNGRRYREEGDATKEAPWKMSLEDYTRSMGTPEPKIDALSDSSGFQRSRMSDRAKNEMLKEKSMQRKDARKKYESSVSLWENSVIDAFSNNDISLYDAWDDTDAGEFMISAALKAGIDVPSPFKLRRMEDADRRDILQKVQSKIAANPSLIRAAIAPKERWQMTKEEDWHKRFDDLPYGRITSASKELYKITEKHMDEHRKAVEDALKEGKPVPPEVLAGYPDIKPQAKINMQSELKPENKALEDRPKKGKAIFSRGEVVIKDRRGDDILVKGPRVGDFLVQTLGKKSYQEWKVIHIPSKRAVYSHFDDKNDALKVAHQLSLSEAKWDGQSDDPPDDFKEKMNKVLNPYFTAQVNKHYKSKNKAPDDLKPGDPEPDPESVNYETMVKIAADSISKLRAVDVYRVLEESPNQNRAGLASYIKQHRPDLVDDVDDAMIDLPSIDPEPPKPTSPAPKKRGRPAKVKSSAPLIPAAKPPITKAWPFPKGAKFLFYKAVRT